MLTATVIGANGFVGSAFVRYLKRQEGVVLRAVTRESYAIHAGKRSDIVIDAAGNSKKFVAEKEPARDFDLSVTHRLRTLVDFPAECHLHISSVDVYSDLASVAQTDEGTTIDLGRQSHYGFNKLLAEHLVQHHASRWLILRLAGMVGAGLRKNPVFDIINRRPVFINPDSQYQFMQTDEVASIAMTLFTRGISGEIFNICGSGLISPAQIAALADVPIEVSPEAARSVPRIVDVNIDKIQKLVPITPTRRCIEAFLTTRRSAIN